MCNILSSIYWKIWKIYTLKLFKILIIKIPQTKRVHYISNICIRFLCTDLTKQKQKFCNRHVVSDHYVFEVILIFINSIDAKLKYAIISWHGFFLCTTTRLRNYVFHMYHFEQLLKVTNSCIYGTKIPGKYFTKISNLKVKSNIIIILISLKF